MREGDERRGREERGERRGRKKRKENGEREEKEREGGTDPFITRLFDFEAPAPHEFELRSPGDEKNPLRRSLSTESIPRSPRTVANFLS